MDSDGVTVSGVEVCSAHSAHVGALVTSRLAFGARDAGAAGGRVPSSRYQSGVSFWFSGVGVCQREGWALGGVLMLQCPRAKE